MSNHNDIHDLLPLAAAGALDPAAQRQVEEHLSQCSDCRAELASWQRLTGALEALPTPQAPLGLVERTRRHLESQAVARAEYRRKRTLLFVLAVFAWMFTWLSWLLFQMLRGKLADALDISSATLTTAWIGYALVSWLATAFAAALLGKRYQQEGRTV
jgi:anti-sigma factor RsiW